MRYKISEVANLLDITTEAVRHYETKGIITPTRSEATGYRYYSGWEIHMLIRARTYRELGYSLEEIDKLLNNYETNDIVSNLSIREDDIKKEIAWRETLLKHIKMEKKNIEISNKLIGQYTIENRPEMYRLEMQENYKLYSDKDVQDTVVDWIDKVPLVFTSTLFSKDDINNQTQRFSVGLGVYKDYSELLNIKQSKIIKFLPSELCMKTGIKTKSSEVITAKVLIPAIEYMESNGMKLSGDVITKSILMRKVGDDYINWHQAWIPFTK